MSDSDEVSYSESEEEEDDDLDSFLTQEDLNDDSDEDEAIKAQTELDMETAGVEAPRKTKKGLLTAKEQQSWSMFRRYLYLVVESKLFSGFILSVILLNTGMMTLQTMDFFNRKASFYMSTIDNAFLGIYLFEVVLKLIVFRRKFFKSGWNNFDLFIVASSGLDFVQFFIRNIPNFNPKIFRTLRLFRAFRAVRALRVLRTIAFLKNLQVIVNTLLSSIPAMGSIVLLISLILYIFAIIGRDSFGSVYPERFGTLGKAIFALFQLITLDDWFEFYEDLRHTSPEIFYYLIVYIVLETFIFINLFTAVIVNNLQASQMAADKNDKKFQAKENQKKLQENIKLAKETAKKRMDILLQTKKQNIEAHTKGRLVDLRTKHLTTYYHLLLASLENNVDFYQKHQKRLDQLVDMVKVQDNKD